MLRWTRGMAQGLLRPTGGCGGRFVPPWERDGKSADEFFSGMMQSGNPVTRGRRDKQREEEAQRHAEAERAMQEAAEAPARRAIAEAIARNEAIQEQQRTFLPYAAVPMQYFEATKMAAWGDYQQSLRQGPSMYSPHAQHLLAADMETKLPYRYDDLIPKRPRPPPVRPHEADLQGSAIGAASTPVGGECVWPLHGACGIVLDLDGVVFRANALIDSADDAIRRLLRLRVPLLFMTNGGSMTEEAKAAELSARLSCHIDPAQVLLSHTPMRHLVPIYGKKRVLVVGKPRCAEVARHYGFENVVPILQYQAEHPELFPYKTWRGLEDVKAAPGSVPYPEIDAILQLGEPEDVFSDIQALVDIMTAPRGQVGRYVSATQTVPYFVCADDLLWPTAAPLPRLGQGAFREMLSSVFESVTGSGLHCTMYGKPRAIAYAYAEQRMAQWAAHLSWDPADMRAIFMVGDNLLSDIVGANARGRRWVSVHVLSGIGQAPAARRTLAEDDVEIEWMEECVSKTPHYISPTLDHFVRELMAFPESVVLQNKTPYYGRPNLVDLLEQYNFRADVP